MTAIANASAVFGLIALRALADLDPVEYRRCCDASRAALDRRIEDGISTLQDAEKTMARAHVQLLHGVGSDAGETFDEERLRLKSVMDTCRAHSTRFALMAGRP